MSRRPETVTTGPWAATPLTIGTTSTGHPGAAVAALRGIPPVTLLLGVPVDVLSMADALDRITELVRSGRSTGRSHQVVTVNVDFLINASHSESLRWILRRSQLAIADGMPLVWASRLLGAPLPERVAGSDLIPLLAERCQERDFSMLLFGGALGVADAAADVLRRSCPGLRIETVAAPFFEDPTETHPEVLDAIRAHRPDIVCVALGHPKQDRWIAAHGRALGVPLMIGVGGSLDFLAGTTRRAPAWMQRSGFEWVHRLAHEPRRLAARYGRDLVHFGPRVTAQRLGRPTLQAPTGRSADDVGDVPVTVLWPSGGEPTTVGLGSGELLAAAAAGVHAVIDVQRLGWPTWDRVLLVVALARHLQRHGGDLLVLDARTAELWWRWHHHLDGLVTVAPEVEVARAVAAAGSLAPGALARRTIGRTAPVPAVDEVDRPARIAR